MWRHQFVGVSQVDEGQVLKDQTPGQTGQGESETGVCGPRRV